MPLSQSAKVSKNEFNECVLPSVLSTLKGQRFWQSDNFSLSFIDQICLDHVLKEKHSDSMIRQYIVQGHNFMHLEKSKKGGSSKFLIMVHSLPHSSHSILQNNSHLCCFCLEISEVNYLSAQVVSSKAANHQLHLHMHSRPECWPEKTKSDGRPRAGKSFQYDGGHKSSFPSSAALLRGYMVLRGKSALHSWSCNNITERMLCDTANYPLFPPLNITLFISARKQI